MVGNINCELVNNIFIENKNLTDKLFKLYELNRFTQYLPIICQMVELDPKRRISAKKALGLFKSVSKQ